MDLFRFLKRQIRASVPPPQPIQPAEVARNASNAAATPDPAPPPTSDEIRRLLFDAVASGDESRLHDLCKEHHDLIVRHGEAWLEVPPEFRTSPQLQGWYANGLRAIRDYCAQKASENELTEGIREVLEASPTRPTVFRDEEH
jgi:hypothetical protein